MIVLQNSYETSYQGLVGLIWRDSNRIKYSTNILKNPIFSKRTFKLREQHNKHERSID